jgi:hypothetical protein
LKDLPDSSIEANFTPIEAKTLIVDPQSNNGDTFKSIAAAVDVAQVGDIIQLTAGTYTTLSLKPGLKYVGNHNSIINDWALVGPNIPGVQTIFDGPSFVINAAPINIANNVSFNQCSFIFTNSSMLGGMIGMKINANVKFTHCNFEFRYPLLNASLVGISINNGEVNLISSTLAYLTGPNSSVNAIKLTSNQAQLMAQGNHIHLIDQGGSNVVIINSDNQGQAFLLGNLITGVKCQVQV